MEVITNKCIICEVDVPPITVHSKGDDVKLALQLFLKLLQLHKELNNGTYGLIKFTEKDNELVENSHSKNVSCCEDCWRKLGKLLRLQTALEEIQESLFEKVDNLKTSLLRGSRKDNRSTSSSIRNQLISCAQKAITLSSTTTSSQEITKTPAQPPNKVIRQCSISLTRLSPPKISLIAQPTVKVEESEESFPELSDHVNDTYFSENEPSIQSPDQESSSSIKQPVKKPGRRSSPKIHKKNLESNSEKIKIQTNQNEYLLRLSDNLLLYRNTLIAANYGENLKCLQKSTSCDYTTNGTDYEAFQKIMEHVKTIHLENYLNCSLDRKCPKCEKEFTTFEILRDHLTSCYDYQSVYICPSCWKSLKSKEGLKCHQWTHKNLDEKGNQDEPSSLSRKKKLRENSKKLYYCEYDGCGKKFILEGYLKTHQITHLPKNLRKQYNCPECSRIFYTAVAVRGHVEREHNKNLMRFRYCPVCNKKYNWRNGNNFRIHVKTHTGENLKIFEECGKVFMRIDTFKYHLELCRKKKSGEDVGFQCELCEKRYSHLGGLRRHKKTMHMND